MQRGSQKPKKSSGRPDGYDFGWKPQQKTHALLEAVQGVLEEYHEHLPLTGRQIFYRLVGTIGYPKTEKDYINLLDKLKRARRAGIIPFEAIRDDGIASQAWRYYGGEEDFWRFMRGQARRYTADLLEGQAVRLRAHVEAAGVL